MEQNINSVQVRVVEDDPKGITINVRNNPDKNGCNATVPTTAPPEPNVSNTESPPGEPPRQPTRKPRRKRDSIQYRDTGQWRDLVAKEWAAVAADESLAGMTLEQFKGSDPGRDHRTRRTGSTPGCSERRNCPPQSRRSKGEKTHQPCDQRHQGVSPVRSGQRSVPQARLRDRHRT